MAEGENNLMVVDALNLAFRWKHQGATDFFEDYLRTVQSLKRSYKAKWVIIAADQGSSWYRKEIHPEYKQNRKDKFAEQTEDEKLAFELFFEDYQKTLDHIRRTTDFPVIQFPKTEADDIAAYISVYSDIPPVDHIWLVSSDRDWDLLISERVSRFSYVTRKEVTADNWHEHYDCTKDDYISVKCLQGDTGDNVPGVPLIGPKRALELIQKYGTAMDIAASLPLSGSQKFIQNLNASGDLIMRNYQLMDLVTFCRDALGDNTKQIDEILQEYIK